jgi:RimJ/RimL family protein N-acetyltransferase
MGKALVARLAEMARREGITELSATCFASNRHMIQILENLGDTKRTYDGGAVELRVRLPGGERGS